MTLAEQLSRQFKWRSWDRILRYLPDLQGRTVLDLGCGIGDQAALLAAHGAKVIGLDQNEALLAAAKARAIPNVDFRHCNLCGELPLAERIDGVWCSFTAAYFPALVGRLAAWTRHLNLAGWIALTEVHDLFAHEPVSSETRAILDAYCNDALRTGRYDFRMGGKLAAHLQAAGFTIVQHLIVPDAELSPAGPASADVLLAWEQRFDRMSLLRKFCGGSFHTVRDEFLASLAHPQHRSQTQVYCVVGKLSQCDAAP